jgi:hypothetical protein
MVQGAMTSLQFVTAPYSSFEHDRDGEPILLFLITL